MSTPGRTRTCNPRFRRPMLYPLSYGRVTWLSVYAVNGRPAPLSPTGIAIPAGLSCQRLCRSGKSADLFFNGGAEAVPGTGGVRAVSTVEDVRSVPSQSLDNNRPISHHIPLQRSRFQEK